jgi:putative transposase
MRGGAAWRMLPHDLPPWNITYHYFRIWRKDGTWERIHDQLRGDVQEAVGREREPSAGLAISGAGGAGDWPIWIFADDDPTWG